MELIKTDRKTYKKANININLWKQLTVRIAHKCVHITVHNCITQYCT